MFDVISIGDVMVDAFLLLSESEVKIDRSNEVEKLVMEFGTKLPIEKMIWVPAVGNAANVANASARMGLSAAIYTIVGDDHEGNEAKRIFQKEGVSIEYVRTDEGTRTNFSAVLSVAAERTILVYHEHRNYDLPGMKPTKWVYYTSLSKGHEILHHQIPEYCDRVGAKLAFQPGSHQLREGMEVLRPEIARSDFLVMNKEEAEGLLGKEAECPELIGEFLKIGAKMVTLTDGAKGAYASRGDEMWFTPIYEAPVVEATGCGDAYASGFLGAIIKGLPIPEAMKWGSVNAAGVLGHVGAREGLLSENEIREWIGRRPEWGSRKV